MSNFFFYKDGNKIKPEKNYDKIKFNNGWVGQLIKFANIPQESTLVLFINSLSKKFSENQLYDIKIG